MAVVYTTATLVKKRIEDIDASLLDADIEQYIQEAENIIDVVMTESLIDIFDATKHSVIRSVATDLAALSCIRYNPGAFSSLEVAEMTANMLLDNIQFQFYLLSNSRTVEYLKSL
jgi:hypothetical protein